MPDPDAQTLAEEFNSCVATAGSDQHTLNIDKVKQGTSEFINELNDFIDQFSIPAVSGNPGIFAGLSIAAVALAGTWGELSFGFGSRAGGRWAGPIPLDLLLRTLTARNSSCSEPSPPQCTSCTARHRPWL